MSRVSVEVKLGVDKFFVDEHNPHIVVKKGPVDPKELKKLINACPANLYKQAEDGSIAFDYAGCFECGTCRVLCLNTLLEKWEYPNGTMGIEYRYG